MTCCGKQRTNFKTKLAKKKKIDIENTPDEKLNERQLRMKKRKERIEKRNERIKKRNERIVQYKLNNQKKEK